MKLDKCGYISKWLLIISSALSLLACGSGGGGGGSSSGADDTTGTAETPIVTASGSGTNSDGATLVIDVTSSPLGGTVTYVDLINRLNFESTSITEVSEDGGTVIITGEGTVTDISMYEIAGYTFTATITGSSASIQVHSPLTDIDGSYTVTASNITGFGMNSDGSILNINVDSITPAGSVTYYDALPRLNFESTSITGVSEDGGTVTITGEGKVTDILMYEIAGYTFTVTITGSTASIQVHSPLTDINGTFSVTTE